MRFFAIVCFAVAMFYGWTAVEAMRTGVAHSLGKNSAAEHRRDDPQSEYRRCLFARWLISGGFGALGLVMQVIAGRFERLESDAGR